MDATGRILVSSNSRTVRLWKQKPMSEGDD